MLTLSGPAWSLACTSSWRLILAGRLVTGGEEESAARHVADLVGRTVVRCESLTSLTLGDLRLVLDDGRALEVFVAAHIDPWVLRLPRGPVLVPAPGDPNWAADLDDAD